MARNGDTIRDWHIFSQASSLGGARPLRSRYPLELAPDLIVCPHLYDWPAEAPVRNDVYTCAGRPRAIVFCARGEEHLRFLADEVVPRVHEHVEFVALIDADRLAFDFAPTRPPSQWLGIEHLSRLLRLAYGKPAIDPALLLRLGASPATDREPASGPRSEPPGDPGAIERHPLRLWEAFFWRGHSYCYELVDGEVPLVGDLLTPLGANRTLLQFVRDAEVLEGARADEAQGWLRCGRFRMRQVGRLVDVRVRLDPADRHVAFLPQADLYRPGTLPSLVGALLAGGYKGKTQLDNGFTWATIRFDSAPEQAAFEAACRETIERWVGASAELVDGETFKLPDEPNDTWFVCHYGQNTSIFVPFHRHDFLPWNVATSDW